MLSKSTYLPVTSIQDFFSISTIEAICAGVLPFLPNRLVFPEHLPTSNSDFIYDSEEELFEMMKRSLTDKKYVESLQQIKKEIIQFVSNYDWNIMRPIYLNNLG